MRVVVVLVLGQHVDELPLVEDQHPVQALTPDRAHPPLGMGVALRSPRRSTQHLNVGVSEDLVEARGELRVAITDQEPETVSPLPHRVHEVASLLGDPLAGRMPRHPENVDSAGTDLDDEEHVDATQQHRVDGEEITRQHCRRLGSTEVPPRQTSTAWRRIQSRVVKDVPDGRWSDPVTQSDQFAVDSSVTHVGLSRANRITKSRMTAAVRGRPPTGFDFGG